MRVLFASIGVVALAIFLLNNWTAIVESWQGTIGRYGLLWLALGLAVVVHLVGHLFRVLRTKIVIDEVNRGSVKGQFGALAIGFLFNALLPFRLGEVIRSLVISRTLRISLLYTLAAVALERLFDVIFIGVAVIAVASFSDGNVAQTLVVAAVGLIVVSLVVVVLFVSLVLENRAILSLFWRATGLLNPELSNTVRFKIWTLIFGFQRLILDRSKLWRYIAFALASWVCYLASVAAVGLVLLPGLSGPERFVSASYPFIAINSLWGQVDLASYIAILNDIIGPFTNPASVVSFGDASWLLLVVPMSVLGAGAMLFLRVSPPIASQPTEVTVFENKLRRLRNISSELPAFLDSYFRGQDLARVLHRIEVAGGFSLVKFFRGGSEAVTVLALSHGELFVKKIVPRDRSEQLRRQRDWLEVYAGEPGLVRLLGTNDEPEYFAIDLAYVPGSEAVFDYVHRVSSDLAKKALEEAWDRLVTSVHRPGEIVFRPALRDDYVQRLLIDRVAAAGASFEPLRAIVKAREIVVNGERLDGLAVVLDKIRRHATAWADIASYRETAALHGDFTIDNLLINADTDEIIVIDPSDDNPMRSVVMDLARLKQSLTFGYEFLIADDSAVATEMFGDTAIVDFPDFRSARYQDLDAFVDENMVTSLMETERRALLFHTGLFYGRMLTHRVRIAPHSAAKYYATSMIALNRFYGQY
jgi:hypothetical protein